MGHIHEEGSLVVHFGDRDIATEDFENKFCVVSP